MTEINEIKINNKSSDENLSDFEHFSIKKVMREFLIPEEYTELSKISNENFNNIIDVLPKSVVIKGHNSKNLSKNNIKIRILSTRLSFVLENKIISSLELLNIIKQKNPKFITLGLKKWSEKKINSIYLKGFNEIKIKINLTQSEIKAILEIFIKKNKIKKKNE